MFHSVVLFALAQKQRNEKFEKKKLPKSEQSAHKKNILLPFLFTTENDEEREW